jgi:formate dehydrogenase major subunit
MRGVEMFIKHSICPSCSVGCGINLIKKNEKIVGIYPYKNHPVNEGKNCLKGKNSYKVLEENRVLVPLEKKQNKMVGSNWEKALDTISETFNAYSSNEIGILCSGKNTNEEIRSIKEFAKSHDIGNIGFFSHNFPEFTVELSSYDDIDNAKFIFVIGDIIEKNPLIGRRLIVAKEKGAEIFSTYYSEINSTSINSDKYFRISSISQFLKDFPKDIKNKLNESSVIIFNKLEMKEDYEKIIEISNNTNSKILPVLDSCNSYGAMKHIPPLDKNELIQFINNVKVVLTINDDFLSYFSDDDLKNINLNKLNLFSVSTSLNPTSLNSNIVIPYNSWIEKSGTFTNTVGTIQSFEKIIEAPNNILTVSEILDRIGKNQ